MFFKKKYLLRSKVLIISSSRKVNFWTCPDKIAGTRPVSLPSWNMIMDGNCLVNGEVLTWYFTATSGYLPTSILPVKKSKKFINNIFSQVSSKAELLQLNHTKILAYPYYIFSKKIFLFGSWLMRHVIYLKLRQKELLL